MKKTANTNKLKPRLVEIVYMVVSEKAKEINTPIIAKIPIMERE